MSAGGARLVQGTMHGMVELSEAAVTLRRVLDSVGVAPDVMSDPALVGYLAGAADALELVAQRGRPDVNDSGRLGRDAAGEE